MNSTNRIVVVYGQPGPALSRVLTTSGLEPVTIDPHCTIWAPTLPHPGIDRANELEDHPSRWEVR